ncbi:MAG TPA: prepilin-type N-terminal cleavage/methylation domain-containing protein [Gemmatimonadales bacterium]|nr:prepilin-type N-terminal cleavage/methylation domain-containing protein [Gemmatimonadales bacterium]
MTRSSRAGFSLLEMLISLVVLSVIMAAAISVLKSQSQSFLRGSARMDLNQNARFALTTIDRTLRTLGAGTTEDQPMLIYADNQTIAFNANFASDSSDGTAVYLNPDLPANVINGLTTATPITIPGTAITYPTRNYTWVSGQPSRAETIILMFRPDSSTPAPGDYVLLQKVNNAPSELSARSIRAYPGRPFFEFWYDSAGAGGRWSRQLDPSRLPSRHTAAQHGSPSDVGNSARADSIRLVRVSFVSTNGFSVPGDTASRAFSSMIALTNNGLQIPRSCGNPPAPPPIFSLSPDGPGRIQISWGVSSDETGGERDVIGYNIYYRLLGSTVWQTLESQAAGRDGYGYKTAGFELGQTYQVGVSAVDCTPSESTIAVRTVTIDP